jgi:hypothetical protein
MQKNQFRFFACLATLVALIASREDANPAQKKVASSNVSTAVLYTDGWIIRLAEDDQSETSHQAPDTSDHGDNSGQSSPP